MTGTEHIPSQFKPGSTEASEQKKHLSETPLQNESCCNVRLFLQEREVDLTRISQDGTGTDFHYPLSENERTTLNFCRQWLAGEASFEIQTSGSTGQPKSIHVLRSQMVESARATGRALNLKKGQRSLVCLPSRYIAGRMMIVRGFVLGLDTIVIEPTADPFAHLSDDTPTLDFVAMVPLQMMSLLDGPSSYMQRLNHMQAILVGGGPINSSLLERMQTVDAPVYHTFGMTETVTHFALRRLNGPRTSDAYVPLPGVKLGTDQRGCLWVKSPVTLGQTVQTNDMIDLRPDGTFIWLGRLDNVINSGGVKVHPEKVERAMEQVLLTLGEPGLSNRRFFVGGLVDDRLGQQVTAIFEGEPLSTRQENRIRQQLAEHLTKFEIPRVFKYVSQMLETPTKKIDRSATVKM